MKKISIIVPVYNLENYLSQSIPSIINQTYKNIEIIIINDGSTDNSKNIIEKYAIKDDRIKIINKKNGGLCSSRNEGIKNSSGEYILHVDGDDILPLDICEEYISLIKKNPDIDIIESNFILFYEEQEKKIINKIKIKKEIMMTSQEYLEQKYFTGKGTISIWGKLIKSSLYKEHDIYHPLDFSLAEDGCTFGKLLINSKKIIITPKIGYYYRQNLNSMTAKKKVLDINQYKRAFENIKEYFLLSNYKKIFKKNEFKCKVIFYYYQLFRFSYNEAKKFHYKDYIKGYNEFFCEIKNIKNIKKDLENFNLKIYILLYIFKKNIKLGNFIVSINNKKWNR